MNATSVLHLPIDVLGAVCRYLSLHDMVGLLKVCQWFNREIRRLPIWWPKICNEGTPYDQFHKHFLVYDSPFLKSYMVALAAPDHLYSFADTVEIELLCDPPVEWTQLVMVTYHFHGGGVSIFLFGYHKDMSRVFQEEILHGNPHDAGDMQERIGNGVERLHRSSWMGITALVAYYRYNSRRYFPPPKIDEVNEGHWIITR